MLDKGNQNRPLAGCTVEVIVSADKRLTETTDAAGMVTFSLPVLEEYTFNISTEDGRTFSQVVSYSDLEKNPKRTFYIPAQDSYRATINVYGDGTLLKRFDDIVVKRDANRISSNTSFEGITECNKVEAFGADGNLLNVELATRDDDGRAYCKIADTTAIDNGETITINFYYTYTDQGAAVYCICDP